MKKCLNILVICAIVVSSIIPAYKVNATTEIKIGTIMKDGVQVKISPDASLSGNLTVTAKANLVSIRTEPDASDTDGDPKATKLASTDISDPLLRTFDYIEDSGYIEGSGCPQNWYKIKYNESDAYVCNGGDDLNGWISIPEDSSILRTVDTGYKFTIIEETAGSVESGCATTWYKLKNSDNEFGYVCEGTTENENVTVTDQTVDISAEFPQSYATKLLELQKMHPNWVFKAYNTGIDWDDFIEGQNSLGKALIQTSSVGFRSSLSGSYNWLTDSYYQFEPSWYAAHDDSIAYYGDPRNFLNEVNVFMFHKQNYTDSMMTDEDVKSVLTNIFAGTWMETVLPTYADVILAAAKAQNVDPIQIATRIKQEMGGGSYDSAPAAAKGGSFTYEGVTDSGYYNFFNIGAYGSVDPAARGIAWAKGVFFNPTNGINDEYDIAKRLEYGLPWDTPEKAINYGTYWIGKNYISVGQDTAYYQKWNVVGGTYEFYTHQYMTNVMAPMTEASKAYYAYSDNNILGETFVFEIPVFTNMPNVSSLPDPGNPNFLLSSLIFNGNSLSGFDPYTDSYTQNITQITDTVNVSASTISSRARITGIGDISTTEDQTIVEVLVTAENGDTKTYTITVNKVGDVTVGDILTKLDFDFDETYLKGVSLNTNIESITADIYENAAEAVVTIKDINDNVKSPDKKLGTGDKVIITIGPETKTYLNIVNGDLNGDADVSIIDLLRVQKIILGDAELSEPFIKAGDVNGDNEVSLIDLLRVQKHILGDYTIE